MKLMTYNILESGEGRVDPLAEVIRQAGADTVVLQECADRGLLAKLANRVGMEFFLAENPKNKDAAVGLLTRERIVEAVNYSPLDSRITRAAFHATLRTGAGEITVIGLHLHPHETLEDERVRLSELPAILEIAGKFADRPHVLAGDFNTSHPQQVIDVAKLRPAGQKRIAGQGNVLPRELVSRLLAAGYVDAHALGRAPAEFGVSFTTAHPAMRVDYIFVPAGMAGKVRSCEVFAAPIGRFASDHYPVVAELAL